MTQSKVDPCLFYGNGSTFVCYIDDWILFSKNQRTIDAFIQKLCNLHFPLTIEGDLHEYLCINVTRDKATGTDELKETGLIDRILKTMPMMDCNDCK